MSKDEIINKHQVYMCNNPGVHAAMDEYAKQEAIAFGMFVCVQGFNYNGEDSWIGSNGLFSEKKEYTTKQLYELYIQSKQ